MLIHGMSWRTKQSNHGNFRDADGFPEKLKQLVKHCWGLSLQLLLLLLSLGRLPSLSLEISFFYMARNTAINTSWVLYPETSTMGDGLNYTFSGEKGDFVTSTGRFCPFLDRFTVLWGRRDGVIYKHGHFLRTIWFDWGKSISKRMGVKFTERGTLDR